MLRILILAAFGYCAYRAGREFIDSVPDDFDVVGPPKPVPVRASNRKTRRAYK